MSTKPMREIKFRAWDKEKTRMRYLENADFQIEYCGIIEVREFDSPKLRDWPLMQYTGLKALDDVDPYIGDIAKLSLLSGDRISEIKLCEKRQIPVVKFFEEEGWEPLHRYAGTDKDDTSIEIIGNIYEHPHLLENNHE